MSESSGEPLELEACPAKEQWIACYQNTDNPITYTGSLGTYIPVWDNPMSAHEWAQSLSRRPEYYIREVEMLYLARRE